MLWTVIPGAGFAAPADVIKAGDNVEMHYTCKLNNGEIVATSEQPVADNESLKKSSIFVPDHKRGTVEAVAGDATPYSMEGGPNVFQDFEQQVEKQLAKDVIGLNQGEHRDFQLRIDPLKGGPEQNYLRLARVRERPKEMRIAVDAYKARTKRDPAIGDAVSPWAGDKIFGKISEIYRRRGGGQIHRNPRRSDGYGLRYRDDQGCRG